MIWCENCGRESGRNQLGLCTRCYWDARRNDPTDLLERRAQRNHVAYLCECEVPRPHPVYLWGTIAVDAMECGRCGKKVP